MMKYTDLLFLGAPLPEDVEKLKWHGDLAHAARRIDKYLEGDLPQAQCSRLEAEKEVLRRLPEAYTLTWEEAVRRFDEVFEDASAGELEELVENGAVDWIWCEGERRIIYNFAENLLKTRPAYSARAKGEYQDQVRDNQANAERLDQVIHTMQEKGQLPVAFYPPGRGASPQKGPGGRPRDCPGASAAAGGICPGGILHPAAHFGGACLHCACRTAPPHHLLRRPMKAGETIEVEFSYTIRADYVRPDPSKVLNEQPTFYTEEQLPHIALTPYIRAVAAEITGGDKNPLIRARRIYDYITSHLMYSFVSGYGDHRYSRLCGFGLEGRLRHPGAALCHPLPAADIPARWQSGLYTTPVNVGCHDWAQFYVEPYGWLFADCSFGGSAWRAGSTLRHDFYFGNLEPFRMPAASDFQQEFSPARKFPRNDPYDNQVGEAEYADRPMEARGI